MGDVLELGIKKACTQCGHAPGGHEPTCYRHANHMRAIAAKREEDYRTGKVARPQRGQKRLRLGRRELDEVTTSAAELLYGDRASAVELLRKQLKSKDERVAQRAAVSILAYTDGTPTQRVETKTDNTTEVVYRSAALAYEEFVPGAEADAG